MVRKSQEATEPLYTFGGFSVAIRRRMAIFIHKPERSALEGASIADGGSLTYFAGAFSRGLEPSDCLTCFSASASIVLTVAARFASASAFTSRCLRSSSADQFFE